MLTAPPTNKCAEMNNTSTELQKKLARPVRDNMLLVEVVVLMIIASGCGVQSFLFFLSCLLVIYTRPLMSLRQLSVLFLSLFLCFLLFYILFTDLGFLTSMLLSSSVCPSFFNLSFSSFYIFLALLSVPSLPHNLPQYIGKQMFLFFSYYST